MKTEILDVILDDPAFRAGTLRRVKRLAHRRRISRRVGQAAILGALLIAAVWMVRGPEPVTSVKSASFREVRTEAGMFAEVHSMPSVATDVAAADVRVFGTWDLDPDVKLLDDRELVATLRAHRAMLINPGSPDARIVRY